MSLRILEEALLWYPAIRLRSSHPRSQERLRPRGEWTAILTSHSLVAFGGPENSPSTSKVGEHVMVIVVVCQWLTTRLAKRGGRDPKEAGVLDLSDSIGEFYRSVSQPATREPRDGASRRRPDGPDHLGHSTPNQGHGEGTMGAAIVKPTNCPRHRVGVRHGQQILHNGLPLRDTHLRSTPLWCITRCLAEDEFISHERVEGRRKDGGGGVTWVISVTW